MDELQVDSENQRKTSAAHLKWTKQSILKLFTGTITFIWNQPKGGINIIVVIESHTNKRTKELNFSIKS